MHRWHHHRRHMHHHARRFGPWAWEGRFFEKGELPLALLSLLADGPKHGYELMKALEARCRGLYTPAAGTIYPTLQQMQDQELVASLPAEGGKRVYEPTDAGRTLLAEVAETIKGMWARVEDEEWDGWGAAGHVEAAHVMRPAFRLMRTAVRSVARAKDAERADQVRDILRDARERIKDLDKRRANES